MLRRFAQARPAPADGALAAFVIGAAVLFVAAMCEAASAGSAAVPTALALALLPLALVLAWRAPLIFPFGVYAMLVPFDGLLSVEALGTAARLCGALSGIALFVWVLRRRTFVRPGAPAFAWLAFAAWSAVSMTWALDPSGAPRETGTLVQVALLYGVLSIVPVSLGDLRAIVVAVAAGGVAAAIFGAHEMMHLNAVQQLIGQESDRIPLLIGRNRLDINQFADSLLLPAAIAIVAAVRAKRFAYKVLAVGAIGALFYAMTLAASREAFVAVGVMSVYFIVVLPERRQIVGLGIVLASLVAFNANLWNRFTDAVASGGSGRTSIWGAGIAAFRQHWLLGAGSGSFATAYNRIYLDVFQRYDMGWSRAAHNMLLQNLVEYGIVGTAILVAALVLTFLAIPKVGKDDPLYGLRAALIGGLAGLCVASFFVDLTTAKIFWLGLGLAALFRSHVLGRTKRLFVPPANRAVPVLAALAVALLASRPASAAPRHVLTFLYYHQSFGATDVNAKLSPRFMVAHADFVETSGFDNDYVNKFKAAGGRFGMAYVDPTFVPYCVPPFTEPAGLCAGQVGNLRPAASAWFHDAKRERVRRSDSYTSQFQEILNPASSDARQAVATWMNGYLKKSPSLNYFFADDSGSTLRGPDGTAASGMFYGFNAPATEITTDAAWIAAENAMLGAAPRRLLINGGDLYAPAYNGVFLKNPNVAGANHEGCFNTGAGAVSDDGSRWQKQANGLLADLPFKKYSLCMMNGSPAAAPRLYALASWWLTYDPQYSVAAPIVPAADGNAVFAEFDIVPSRPKRTAGADIGALAKNGVYIREFGACYQDGVAIGGCAAIVNPSGSARRVTGLSATYTRSLRLDDKSAASGGRATWTEGGASSSRSLTLGPVQAVVLRR